MLGAIIGDICGSVYEFNNVKNYDRVKLFAEGCFPTDDSIMTIAVAKTLMDNKGKSAEDIKEALIDSMRYYGKLYPNAGYGARFNDWLWSNNNQPYNSFGNGSAMRVSSVGWMFDTLEETLEYAKLTAEVTHNHPEGIKGAQAVAAAIFLARAGYTKEEIKVAILSWFGYSFLFTINTLRPFYDFDESCQETVPVALEAFFESKDFEDALRLAISVGGDSDTIACITCSIAEAFYGLPEDLCEKAMDILDRNERWDNPVLTSVVREFYKRYNSSTKIGNDE